MVSPTLLASRGLSRQATPGNHEASRRQRLYTVGQKTAPMFAHFGNWHGRSNDIS